MINILLVIFFLILGILFANMLNNICGCKDIVEGADNKVNDEVNNEVNDNQLIMETEDTKKRVETENNSKPKAKSEIDKFVDFEPGSKYALSCSPDGKIIGTIISNNN